MERHAFPEGDGPKASTTVTNECRAGFCKDWLGLLEVDGLDEPAFCAFTNAVGDRAEAPADSV